MSDDAPIDRLDIPKLMGAIAQLRALGVTVDSFEKGRATMSLPWREDLVGFPATGVLAGGAIFTLMDSVLGAAVYSAREVLGPIATLDLRIDYLKPATPHRTVHASAHCHKLTRHVGFVRGVAYHDDPDDAIAHSAASFMLTHLDRPPSAEDVNRDWPAQAEKDGAE